MLSSIDEWYASCPFFEWNISIDWCSFYLQTRNNEKYAKNKDRNRDRDIMLERQKIRFEAVRQAERLAAIHDPTGKSFNVGEVVVMPDGQVKSKEAIERAAETKK